MNEKDEEQEELTAEELQEAEEAHRAFAESLERCFQLTARIGLDAQEASTSLVELVTGQFSGRKFVFQAAQACLLYNDLDVETSRAQLHQFVDEVLDELNEAIESGSEGESR